MKKRIVSLLSALAVAAGLLTPALAKTVTNEELVYENNFNKDFTGLDDTYAGPGIRRWGGWKLIPAYEGDGFAIAIDNSSATRNINIITSSAALTTGTYKMTAKYMPSTATNQIRINASPNVTHTVTDISALERKWYDLQIVVNLDKDTASMKIFDGSTVVWEKSIGYTINLRDITIVQTKTWSGNWTADTTAVIDDLKLVKVTSEVYEIKDSDIKITSKSGDVETDLNAVNPALNSIEVSFGRNMKSDTINENTVKLTEGGNAVSCMYSYDNMVLTIAPQSNLKSNTEYTLTLSEDIQYANDVTLEAKAFTFTTKKLASGLEDVSDSVYANDFNQAFTGLDDNFAGPGIRKWGGWKLIPAYEGDGYAIAVDNSQPTRNINIITSSAALTTGTFKMTAKYMPSTQQNYIYISQVANSGQCKIAITSAEGFERKFYDLEVVVDLDKDKTNINITDGDTVVFTNTTSYNLGLRDITIVQTKTGNGNWTADTTAVLDNLVLNRVYTAAPSITSANFGIYASNILQEDLTNVSTLSDRVEIDLKQQMKAAVLSSENIFVTKKSDGSAVSCSPVYDKEHLSTCCSLMSR